MKKEEALLELLKEMGKELDKALEAVKKHRTPRKEAQVRKRKRLMREKDEIEDKLEEVTNNCYVEIGEFVNEYLEKEIVLLEQTYEKCKNWLDENDKDYVQSCYDCDEHFKEEDDDEPDIRFGHSHDDEDED